jgi:hypothetical protein
MFDCRLIGKKLIKAILIKDDSNLNRNLMIRQPISDVIGRNELTVPMNQGSLNLMKRVLVETNHKTNIY